MGNLNLSYTVNAKLLNNKLFKKFNLFSNKVNLNHLLCFTKLPLLNNMFT